MEESLILPVMQIRCCFYAHIDGRIYTGGELGNSGYNYSLFTGLSCTGSETTLNQCSFTSSGCVPTCANNIGLRCYGRLGCR